MLNFNVSTHSRLKAAGVFLLHRQIFKWVSTHSRLKAAGVITLNDKLEAQGVSTHSRLKAAGSNIACSGVYSPLFQHTAA